MIIITTEHKHVSNNIYLSALWLKHSVEVIVLTFYSTLFTLLLHLSDKSYY